MYLLNLLDLQSCYMDFLKSLNGFVEIDTWIYLRSSCMDFSLPLPNKTKLKFDFKAWRLKLQL